MNESMRDYDLKKEGCDYIEEKLDEAYREAADSDVRYTEDEVFERVKKRIKVSV